MGGEFRTSFLLTLVREIHRSRMVGDHIRWMGIDTAEPVMGSDCCERQITPPGPTGCPSLSRVVKPRTSAVVGDAVFLISSGIRSRHGRSGGQFPSCLCHVVVERRLLATVQVALE